MTSEKLTLLQDLVDRGVSVKILKDVENRYVIKCKWEKIKIVVSSVDMDKAIRDAYLTMFQEKQNVLAEIKARALEIPQSAEHLPMHKFL